MPILRSFLTVTALALLGALAAPQQSPPNTEKPQETRREQRQERREQRESVNDSEAEAERRGDSGESDQIRDMQATLNIPDLIKEGSVAYGMQSFDQSLMRWYGQGIISHDQALLNATNPAEFALKLQGVDGSSDTSWDGFGVPPGH